MKKNIIYLLFASLLFTACEKNTETEEITGASPSVVHPSGDFEGGIPLSPYDPKAPEPLTHSATVPDMPPAINQGATNACGSMAAGLAHGKWVKNRWFSGTAGWPDWLRRSPWYIWRTLNPNNAGFTLTSTFWYISSVMNSLVTHGCCALNAKPTNNGPNDANQNNLAAQRRIGSWGYMANASGSALPVDNNTLNHMKVYLRAGIPVVMRILMATDANFANPNITLNGAGRWNYTAGNRGPYMHYVCVYGYNDTNQELLCRNSWIPWANSLNGQSDFYMSYNTFLYTCNGAAVIVN